jgi:uncharacterized membrane protein SpoIIM required for sporulation
MRSYVSWLVEDFNRSSTILFDGGVCVVNIFKKKQSSCLNYFLQYLIWFLLLVIVSFLLNFNVEKQTINTNIELNNLHDFDVIMANNTLVFIYTFTSVFVGKLNIYIMVIVNAIRIGLLVSRFMYPIYLLMILPHGIPEISVFLLLGACISKYLDNDQKDMKSLIQKSGWLYVALLISALVEAWITPYIVFRFL